MVFYYFLGYSLAAQHVNDVVTCQPRYQLYIKLQDKILSMTATPSSTPVVVG